MAGPETLLQPGVNAQAEAAGTTYFEKALGLARRLDYRLELAATLHWYAKMPLARDAPGDAGRKQLKGIKGRQRLYEVRW